MLRGHGGAVYHIAKRLDLSPHDIADHSSNLSPFPPPLGLYDLLKIHLKEIEYLPEVDSETLRESLAQQWGLSPENFLPSSGTTEWIYAIPKILSPSKVLIVLPTYSNYIDAVKDTNSNIHFFYTLPEENFVPGFQALKSTIKDIKPSLIFICNPNNPTGFLWQ